MEQDKHLQKILLNSTAGASDGFTDSVLRRIMNLPHLSPYKPLINARWQRFFLVAFAVISLTIIVLCLVLILSQIPAPSWWKSINLPDINYQRLFEFVVLFWGMYFIYEAWKKSFKRQRVTG